MVLPHVDVLARDRPFVDVEPQARVTVERRREEPVQPDRVPTGGERKLDVGSGLRPANRFRAGVGGGVEPDAVALVEPSGLPEPGVAGWRVAG